MHDIKKFLHFRNRPSFIIIIIIIFLILVAIVSCIYFQGINFFEDFYSNILATFLGIVIGIPVALWVSDIQETRSEKERNTKILKLLYSELKFNLDNLRYDYNLKNNLLNNAGYLTAFLKDELWKTFLDSGEIQWIKDLTLLDLLSNAYFRIKSFKMMIEWVEKIGPSTLPIFTTPSNMTWYELLIGNMEDTINHIQEALKIIEKHVEIKDKAKITPTFQKG